MRSLTREQLLTIFGLSSGAFDAQQRAGHVALAFGTPSPATPGHYCDLDLAALAIADALAPTLGRPTATTIVLGFFDQWLGAVSEAEADPDRDYFFAIGGFGWGEEKKAWFHELLLTHGANEQILSDLQGARSVIAVNVTQILARLRDKARAAGIDLSQPFFFPPEHERYAQIIGEFQQERAARLARLRPTKKKSRHPQARKSRHSDAISGPNIRAVERIGGARPQPVA
jgi:hypothetical protein